MEKALEVSESLSKRIGSIVLELDGIGMTDSYFRSLFIKVKVVLDRTRLLVTRYLPLGSPGPD